MKKILVIIAGTIILSSCSHGHDKDVIVGNVHTLYLKDFAVEKKKLIDSMKVYYSKKPACVTPEGKGWYSANDMHLPKGTIIKFNPTGETDNTNGKGPYYVITKSTDGKQTITKIDYEKWLLLYAGDVLK